MKKLIYALLIVLVFACNPAVQPSAEELIKIDEQFSSKAEEIGFAKAFIEFAHPEAILLRPKSMPIVGKPAITKLFETTNTEGIQLTWKPSAGDIAKSGEFGFTYGIYTMKRDTFKMQGTYVSIWKKDDEGSWKYMLDTGNEGLE